MRRLGFAEKNKFLFLKHILSVIFGKQKKLLYLKSKQDIIHIKRRIFSEKLCANTVIMKKVEKFFGNTYLNKNQCTK